MGPNCLMMNLKIGTWSMTLNEKICFEGQVVGIQPRIRLLRSFDQRSHSYLGFVLRVDGRIGDEPRDFTVGIGKALQAKHRLSVGFGVSGKCLPAADPRAEPAEYYKVSKFQVLVQAKPNYHAPPPWFGIPPELSVYRQRGHRRLNMRTYNAHCLSCLWGCRMAVEMIVDHWKPEQKRYRVETFCYGPKSCAINRPGAVRKVPGRKGMIWEEEDWVDEDATAHRGPDE